MGKLTFTLEDWQESLVGWSVGGLATLYQYVTLLLVGDEPNDAWLGFASTAVMAIALFDIAVAFASYRHLGVAFMWLLVLIGFCFVVFMAAEQARVSYVIEEMRGPSHPVWWLIGLTVMGIFFDGSVRVHLLRQKARANQAVI